MKRNDWYGENGAKNGDTKMVPGPNIEKGAIEKGDRPQKMMLKKRGQARSGYSL